jgi:hypothetical protein
MIDSAKGNDRQRQNSPVKDKGGETIQKASEDSGGEKDSGGPTNLNPKSIYKNLRVFRTY